MIRFFDLIFSFLGILLFLPIWLILYIICLFDTGSPILAQKRMGKDLKHFKVYKFRTMYRDTEHVASHLACESSVTDFGKFLRKTKLDEFPQLINVFKGDMSLVGPRPVILAQTDVIEARKMKGVYNYLPGITGLSQINKIDTSNAIRLAAVDAKMLRELNLSNYFIFILATVTGKGQGDRIKELDEEELKLKNVPYTNYTKQVE